MKKRPIIIGLITLAMFLAWWHWPRAKTSGQVPPVTVSASKPEAASGNSLTHLTVAPGTSQPAVKSSMKEQLREIMHNGNRPISFFGKVIDQDGNPIPDVKVTFEIRYTKEIGMVESRTRLIIPQSRPAEMGALRSPMARARCSPLSSWKK